MWEADREEHEDAIEDEAGGETERFGSFQTELGQNQIRKSPSAAESVGESVFHESRVGGRCGGGQGGDKG